jgi:hypothetical protein
MVEKDHVGHEVRGILVSVPPPPLDARLAESVLLHLRAVAFFLADSPQGDDVGALSYEPRRWTRPTRDQLLGADGASELNKRLSHLTIRRLEPAFDWIQLLQVIPEVVAHFERFVAALDESWQGLFSPILKDIAAWKETRS